MVNNENLGRNSKEIINEKIIKSSDITIFLVSAWYSVRWNTMTGVV